MKEINTKIQDLYDACTAKLVSLEQRERLIAEREAEIEKRDRKSKELAASHDDREARIAGVENTLQARQQIDKDRAKLNEDISAFEDRKREFDNTRKAEVSKLAAAQTALDEGWKAIKDKEAKIEDEVANRVADFLRKVKK